MIISIYESKFQSVFLMLVKELALASESEFLWDKLALLASISINKVTLKSVYIANMAS